MLQTGWVGEEGWGANGKGNGVSSMETTGHSADLGHLTFLPFSFPHL